MHFILILLSFTEIVRNLVHLVEGTHLIIPEESYMDLSCAIAIPLDEDHKSISLSFLFTTNYYFESSYIEHEGDIPTIAREDNRKKFKIERKMFYHSVQSHFQKYGFSGRDCLLRVICEISGTDFSYNGVLGGILSILFRPSTSMNEFGNITDFDEAEEFGLIGNCTRYEHTCTFNFLKELSLLLA